MTGLVTLVVAQACLDWGALENGACGDGFVGREEACDDGNRISGDGCTDSCKIEAPYCGDGRLDAGEDCDDANELDDDACVEGCRVARCGDGQVWELEERCDDGNLQAGDGCSPDCEIEMAPPGPRCGDGQLDPDEACDDGNDSDLDRCLSGCSWATCGDGRIRSGVEECDDTKPGAGCTKGCLACADDGDYFRGGNAHCYTVHDEVLSQLDARKACQAEGGDLWTATSQAEGSDVALKLGLVGRHWLGLITPVGGLRSWVTGENTMFTAFAPGEPRDKSLRCVAFEPLDGTWSSEPCASTLPFVCERAPAFVSPTDRHAYRLFSGAETQSRASESCREVGGRLLALETDEERVFVGKQLNLVSWLDASLVSDGVFVWPNGEPVDSASWAAGQPDGSAGSQRCLALNQGDRYADGDCGDAHAFVCEFE